MPRRKVPFYKGGLYHITNRGAMKTRIFEDPRMTKVFIDLLNLCARKYEMSVVAYCIMPNHFHLLIRQEGPFSISLFLRVLSRRFAGFFNKLHSKTGAVFQGRFWCDSVENETYLYTVICYIHLNPVKAGLCKHPKQWKSSNYRAFAGLETDSVTNMDAVTSLFGNLNIYSELIKARLVQLSA